MICSGPMDLKLKLSDGNYRFYYPNGTLLDRVRFKAIDSIGKIDNGVFLGFSDKVRFAGYETLRLITTNIQQVK